MDQFEANIKLGKVFGIPRCDMMKWDLPKECGKHGEYLTLITFLTKEYSSLNEKLTNLNISFNVSESIDPSSSIRYAIKFNTCENCTNFFKVVKILKLYGANGRFVLRYRMSEVDKLGLQGFKNLFMCTSP